MSRRNLSLILATILVSWVCYQASYPSSQSRRFDAVLRHIRQHYVEEVDADILLKGALEGMGGELDQYSAYLPPREANQLEELLDQQFGGVGIEVDIDKETGQLIVISPIVGTPAYEAGIMAGDKILEINGESTQGFKLTDAILRMRGKLGEPISLRIQHEGEADSKVIGPIKRAIINVDSVLGDTRNPNGSWNFVLADHPQIGYVRVVSFGEKTVAQLKAALAQLRSQGVKSLILDLRFDPGGLLTAAVETCELFLDSGPIVTIRGRDAREDVEHFATRPGPYSDLPLVVLVNGESASASEIVAACLQDHQRAVIIGERTHGKGTVQELIRLDDGESLLRLTTAYYWRPNGKNIHRREGNTPDDEWGVRPTEGFEIKLTDDDSKKLRDSRAARDAARRPANDTSSEPADGPLFDPQLDKAVDYLQQKLQQLKSRKSVAQTLLRHAS